jgi:hypothetical protein
MNLIFSVESRGYTMQAWEVPDSHDARVTITHGDAMVREGDYPAYRVWNLAAHFDDMLDEIANGETVHGRATREEIAHYTAHPSQHTPEPWTAISGGNVGFSGSAGFQCEPWGNPTPISMADTRLIAAAPALLAALEGLMGTCELNLEDIEPDTVIAINEASAAIRAAKGESA